MLATWNSSDENVLSAIGHSLRLTGLGTAIIAAEFAGLTAQKEFTVVQGVIERIEIFPEEIAFIYSRARDGDTILSWPGEIFVAGFTTSGRQFELAWSRLPYYNELLTFQNVNPEVILPISMFEDAEIVRTEAGMGNIIVASVPSTVSETGTVSAILPVTAHDINTVVRIEIDTGYDINIFRLGYWVGVNVYAVFNDGTKLDISTTVEWHSSNPEIVDIVHVTAVQFGTRTLSNPGQATITATFAGFSDSIVITVEESVSEPLP